MRIGTGFDVHNLNDNRKLIKIKFNKKINTPSYLIDKNDFKVTIDDEIKSIKKIDNINGDLFIILDNFIYDQIIQNKQNMCQLKDPNVIKAFEKWTLSNEKKLY